MWKPLGEPVKVSATVASSVRMEALSRVVDRSTIRGSGESNDEFRGEETIPRTVRARIGQLRTSAAWLTP